MHALGTQTLGSQQAEAAESNEALAAALREKEGELKLTRDRIEDLERQLQLLRTASNERQAEVRDRAGAAGL